MKRTNLTLMLAVLILALAACKKKKVAPQEEILPEQALLVDKDWILTGYTEIFPDGEVDYYPSMSDCIKDNIYRFESSGVSYKDEGVLKCDTPAYYKGKWTLKPYALYEKALIVIQGRDTVTFANIDKISETSLILSAHIYGKRKWKKTYEKK